MSIKLVKPIVKCEFERDPVAQAEIETRAPEARAAVSRAILELEIGPFCRTTELQGLPGRRARFVGEHAIVYQVDQTGRRGVVVRVVPACQALKYVW
jgi:plasmid stabilization system protein ParE